MFIDSVTQGRQSSDTEQAFVNIKICPKQEIKFKLDTLQPTSRSLYGYGGERLVVKGKCNLKCKHKDIEMITAFCVVNTSAPPVLGLKGCIDFGLIKMERSVTETQTGVPVLEKFADVFKGIRQFPGACTIYLDTHATPVILSPRCIPLTLFTHPKEELESMERQSVMAKVTEPNGWVNMVIAEKSGQLRACLDPKDLNKAIKWLHYPLPTLEDITSKLAGARYFSVLDVRSGYWVIRLMEESLRLTTFNSFLALSFLTHRLQIDFSPK